jgi:hypothetical protein
MLPMLPLEIYYGEITGWKIVFSFFSWDRCPDAMGYPLVN